MAQWQCAVCRMSFTDPVAMFVHQCPYFHWSANPSEAQVAAMQNEGTEAQTGPEHRAYAEYLASLNPPEAFR